MECIFISGDALPLSPGSGEKRPACRSWARTLDSLCLDVICPSLGSSPVVLRMREKEGPEKYCDYSFRHHSARRREPSEHPLIIAIETWCLSTSRRAGAQNRHPLGTWLTYIWLSIPLPIRCQWGHVAFGTTAAYRDRRAEISPPDKSWE